MALPPTRINDKIHAAKFRAFAGLVVSVEPHYCNILDPVIVDVLLSPVIVWNLGARRICEDTDVAWNLGIKGGVRSYSPNYDPEVAADHLTSYEIDWGDGNSTGVVAYPIPALAPPSGTYGAAAGEWDLAGAAFITFTITITLTDDDGNATTIYEQIEVVDCTAFPFDAWGAIADAPYHCTTWTAMTAGLDGAWLDVNDVAIMPDKVWIATDAGLAWTKDVGLTWHKVRLDDPPNSWGDVPAPTASDVNYIQIAADPEFPKRLYVLVGWQEPGSAWRGWLYQTLNGGTSFNKYPLRIPDDDLDVGGWLHAVTATDMNPLDCTVGTGEFLCETTESMQNLLGHSLDFADHAGVLVSTVTPGNGGAGCTFRFVVLDFGRLVTLAGGNNSELGTHALTVGANDADAPVVDIERSSTGAVWLVHQTFYFGALPWAFVDDTLTFPIGPQTFRYARIRVRASPDEPGTENINIIFQPAFWRIKVEPPDPGCYDIRPLGLAVDSAGTVYITTHEFDDLLRLQVHEMYSPNYVFDFAKPTRVVELGTATLAEVNGRTWWAKPYCPQILSGDFSGHVFVHGKFPHPTLGNAQIIFSDDTGATFADIGDGWGADDSWVGAMCCDPLREFPIYLVLNELANPANSYFNWLDELGGTWTFGDTDPGFATEALDLHPDYLHEIIVGNRGGVGARAKYTMDNGATWWDVSAGITVGAHVRALKILSER